MKKSLAVLVAVALVAGLVLTMPEPSSAGSRRAEGALIATGVILFGQALGVVPTPRPFYHRPYPYERVIVIQEPTYVYQPAPPVYEPPPYERYWVPGHWEGNVWVSGHWEYRPLDYGRSGYYQPPSSGYYRPGYSSYSTWYGSR